MVGRALEGDVEGDVDSPLSRFLHQLVEVFKRAEGGKDRLVSALFRADRPGAADLARLRAHRVVLALAPGRADRMDRRKVQDVEAQLLHVGQERDDVLERGVLAVAARRAREHLVPRGEARLHGIDHHLERRLGLDHALGRGRRHLGAHGRLIALVG
jgi:hypothetical protein